MPNSSNGQSSMMQKQNEKDGTEKTEPTESSDQGNESEEYVTANNVGEITDHDWGSTEDAEDVGIAVRELVNASVSMMND